MIFSQSILALASSIAVAYALNTSPSQSATSTPCQAALVSPRPVARCGVKGQLEQPSVTNSYSGLTQSQCATQCLSYKGCKSFSYSTSGGVCQLLRRSLQAQGFLYGKSDLQFWSARCYSLQCPSSPSVSVLPDSPQATTRPAAPLPTTTPTSIFQPPVPTDYSSCIAVDPTDAGLAFTLINPSDGIPIVNNNGMAQKATQIVDPIPLFQFSAVDGVPDLYDVTLNGQYLALTIDGDAIFTSQSSGLQYADCGDILCITSLFTYGCDGILRTGIPGVVPYIFGTVDGDTSGQLYGQPDLTQYAPEPDDTTSLVRRSLSQAVRERIAQAKERANLNAMTFVPSPEAQFSVTPGSASTSRCPNTPIGLQAIVKPGSSPPTYNGCGPGGLEGELVPNLWFESCCNGHDLCYGDCSQGFNTCNQNFGDCNRQACYNQYQGDFFAPLEIWGCDQIADFYQHAVSGNSGAKAFTTTTVAHCICQCPTGQDVCNGGDHCQDLLSDPSNCGACGTTCPSGECDNGQCYVPPPPPPPVVANDPCDSNNWLDIPATFISTPSLGTTYPVHYSETVIYPSKADCCKTCQQTPGCAYYLYEGFIDFLGVHQTSAFGGPVGTCGLGIINPSTPISGLSPPKPSQCPLGGYVSGLSSSLSNIGTGNDATTGTVEPGPCDPNFCCN